MELNKARKKPMLVAAGIVGAIVLAGAGYIGFNAYSQYQYEQEVAESFKEYEDMSSEEQSAIDQQSDFNDLSHDIDTEGLGLRIRAAADVPLSTCEIVIAGQPTEEGAEPYIETRTVTVNVDDPIHIDGVPEGIYTIFAKSSSIDSSLGIVNATTQQTTVTNGRGARAILVFYKDTPERAEVLNHRTDKRNAQMLSVISAAADPYSLLGIDKASFEAANAKEQVAVEGKEKAEASAGLTDGLTPPSTE